MKTAVSLPDVLFARAESAAKKLGVSRSRLYAQALGEYLDRAQAALVTARLNEVYATESSELDPAYDGVRARILTRESW